MKKIILILMISGVMFAQTFEQTMAEIKKAYKAGQYKTALSKIKKLKQLVEKKIPQPKYIELKTIQKIKALQTVHVGKKIKTRQRFDGVSGSDRIWFNHEFYPGMLSVYYHKEKAVFVSDMRKGFYYDLILYIWKNPNYDIYEFVLVSAELVQ